VRPAHEHRVGRHRSSDGGGRPDPADGRERRVRRARILSRTDPLLALFGDGRVTEGPQIEIYPGPALPSIQAQIVTEDGIQAILRAARDGGLLGPDRSYRAGCIADAPTTTFTLYADGGKHVVSAYALRSSGTCPGASGDQAPPELAPFADKLSSLGSWLPAGSLREQQTFAFSQTRVFVQAYSGSPDQSLKEPVIDWPLTQSLAAFGTPDASYPDYRCGVVGGSDLSTLLPDLQRANQLTPWQSDGTRYLLTFRPLLPDERGC
jgi:hypothetical protein